MKLRTKVNNMFLWEKARILRNLGQNCNFVKAMRKEKNNCIIKEKK